MPDPSRTLVLASTSPYRAQLLERLDVSFEQYAPGVDETAAPDEDGESLVERLARQKAQAARDRYPDALIIGSDQIALVDGEILGKPGDHAGAVRQLERLSGRNVRFVTGLALVDAAAGTAWVDHVETRVSMRALNHAQIDRYLRHDRPYDCAGSFRSEALGIALFSAVRSDDPTALMGLPLIRLVAMLDQAGLPIP